MSIAALDEDAPEHGRKKADQKEESAKKRERESPDFTIELATTDGTVVSAPVSRFISLPPPLTSKFTKLDLINKQQYHQNWEAYSGRCVSVCRRCMARSHSMPASCRLCA
jgi:hypothetical protein